MIISEAYFHLAADWLDFCVYFFCQKLFNSSSLDECLSTEIKVLRVVFKLRFGKKVCRLHRKPAILQRLKWSHFGAKYESFKQHT